MASDNIFQQYLQPVKSVQDYAAEYDQADTRKQVMQQNALTLAAGQQKFGETQQANQRASQLRAALTGLPQGATDDQRVQAMRATGTPEGFAAADALDKSLIDRRKGMAAAGKDEGDTADKAYKLRIAQHDDALRDMSSFRSPQEAMQSLQQHVAAGDLPPEQAQMFTQQLQSMNPADFPKWQISMVQRLMSAKDDMSYRAPDANTVANNATQRANNAATVAASRYGTDSAARTAGNRLAFDTAKDVRDGAAPKGQLMQGDAGPVIVDPRTGRATPVTMNGAPVAPKGTAAKAQDAQSISNLLDLAEPLLDKATHSIVGRGLDAAAASVGQSTEGAQAAAQLRALEGALISKVPKMSGPQSDKDVLLYRQMAGQIGDPSVPVETRRAAMKTVREISARYSGAPAPAGSQAAGKPSLSDIFGK